MSVYFIDEYSYLHFATGIICFFWGMSFRTLLILHILFELFENSKLGMLFINDVFTIWPGGKPKPDALINQMGDIVFSLIGWLSAYYINHLGKKYGLYMGRTK